VAGGRLQLHAPLLRGQYRPASSAPANTEVTFTVPAPDPPTLVVNFTGDSTLTLIATRPRTCLTSWNMSSRRANDGTNILKRTKALIYSRRASAITSRSLTRYVRSVKRGGRTSSFASGAVTVNAPVAPTLTKDACASIEFLIRPRRDDHARSSSNTR